MAVFINKYNKINIMAYLWRYGIAAILFAVCAASPLLAFAADTDAQFDKIAKNIVTSSDRLPGFISGMSYLLALIFAVTGILKLKEHVTNPTQTPLRVPIIRFIVGGALLALPILYEAMSVAINGGENPVFDPSQTMGNVLSSMLGFLAGFIPLGNANNIMEQVIDSIEETPALVSAVAYLLALLFGVAGLLKIKEHVENPDQTPLREGVIRLLVGGALFAIPMVYSAMFELIGTSIMGNITSIFGAAGMIFSSYTLEVCNPLGGLIGGLFGGTTMGDAICGVFFNAGAFPAFMTALAYLVGLVLGVWGILKIKAHVLNPQQTSLWEGVSRLGAGGAMFALPFIVEVMRNTVAPPASMISSLTQATGFNETAMPCDGTSGLDGILYCMMDDITTPMHAVVNFFTTCAAFVFAMVGISRLTKSAQDGARGPGGLGTLMTFAAAGALISYNALVRAATVTLGMGAGIGRTSTNAVMQYTKGLNGAEAAHIHTVISAIIKFMIIVGIISFVRGIFIVRSVAEGNSQASLMAGVTHMVGGALAVNLGPLINAVQTTLGINAYGITFS